MAHSCTSSHFASTGKANSICTVNQYYTFNREMLTVILMLSRTDVEFPDESMEEKLDEKRM